MFIEISNNLKKLSKYFSENLYVVGGYVRNTLLEVGKTDVDIASSVGLEEVCKRLDGSGFDVKIKNAKCGTAVVSKDGEVFEYTAFRKDVYEDGSHTPIAILPTDKLEEDATRRDFSINAIYYNINKDEVVDLFHGIIDLSDNVIRQIGEDVLKFDGERILRMVRIAGQLGFKIEKNTLKNAQKYVSNVSDLQGQRKFVEIEKLLYCDKRYEKKCSNLKYALNLLNLLKVWKCFGLENEKIKYNMVFKVEDRFLGLLIDIVDTEKPECLEVFLEKLLKEQFSLNAQAEGKLFVFLSGYYHALNGMKNKEFFFKYFADWNSIEPLVKSKSKHLQNKYNFFYRYIIEHNLAISVTDLVIDESDIKKNFANIDRRSYSRIMQNLLSKVFDGKLKNDKKALLSEIEKNLQNF